MARNPKPYKPYLLRSSYSPPVFVRPTLTVVIFLVERLICFSACVDMVWRQSPRLPADQPGWRHCCFQPCHDTDNNKRRIHQCTNRRGDYVFCLRPLSAGHGRLVLQWVEPLEDLHKFDSKAMVEVHWSSRRAPAELMACSSCCLSKPI